MAVYVPHKWIPDPTGPPQGATPPVRPKWPPGFLSITQPGGGGPPGRPGGGGRGNYAVDPLLQEFLAGYHRDRQSALAKRDELRRRRLIQLGSRDVAKRILGESDPVLATITGDPAGTSDFSRVLKMYNDELRGVEEGTSMANTFWGTGRATGYQGAAYTRQQTESDYIKAAEADIQSYQDAYDSMVRELEMQKRVAENEAWMRQMWANMMSGGPSGPGGPGGSGGGGGAQRAGVARQTHNPGKRGQNARYDISGLQRLPDGTYTDGTYRYDENGLSLDRPDEYVEGLPGADEMS